MKERTAKILFVTSLLLIALTVSFAIYAVCDLIRLDIELSKDPAADAFAYWGNGWGYGVILFAASVVDLILSTVNIRLQEKRRRWIAIGATVMSILLIVASMAVFCW